MTTPDSLNLSSKEREFTNSLTFVQTLAKTPVQRLPSVEYLHQLAKEIVNVK